MPDRYVVIGNPIAHSKSPRIHHLFALQTGQDIQYDLLLAPLDGFRETLAHFFSHGGCGANVTVPFKQEASNVVHTLSARACAAGAVNTIVRLPSGLLEGDNTDGIGLLRDLQSNHGVVLKGAVVALIGAGGAARGVAGSLLDAGAAHVVVANRNLARARDLVDAFAGIGSIRACALNDLPVAVDIVINATSSSLTGAPLRLPSHCVGSHTICYDMMYASEPTAFMEWARQLGAARQFDGLGMLVEQAAEAFRIWRNKTPETVPVIAKLREELVFRSNPSGT